MQYPTNPKQFVLDWGVGLVIFGSQTAKLSTLAAMTFF
jgi:hypothetical protein